MNTSLIPTLLIALALIIFILPGLKIANENERFAEFIMGRFAGFKGPGLMFRLLTSKMHRLKVGDLGVVSSPEFVKFGDIEVPVSSASSFRVGEAVRIDGFDDEPRLVASSMSPKHHCPACGHQF